MPFKLPKNGKLSSDIEDRRAGKPPTKSEEQLNFEIDRQAATEGAARHATSNKDFMTKVGQGRLKMQQYWMKDRADKEISSLDETEALRATRQKKTALKFKGVK